MKRKAEKGKADNAGANFLRKRAEDVLRKRIGEVEPSTLSVEDARRLVHELQVHQIELEMQNEELRIAQSMLEESRSKYSDLYDFAPVGYYTFDKEGVILGVNLTGAALLGVERARLIKKSFTVYVAKDYQDAFYLYRRKVLESEERQTCELKLKRADGTEFFAELESVPTEENTINMALIDITGRKKTEEELNLYRESLEAMVEKRTSELVRVNLQIKEEIANSEKMEDEMLKARKLESVGILAGGIAHDFNNALTAIMNNISSTKVLLKTGGNNDKVLGTLDAALKAVRRATAMTQQLLTFARGGEPVRKSVYLRDLITDTVEFSLRGSKNSCDLRLPDDLWPSHVDEGQMAQVISNLVINADQSMPGGGKIEVSAENVRLKKTDALPLKAGRYLKLTVKDRGMGILEENISKIFDPYFTTKQRGSGLGLSTSYSIVKKHEGLITAESKPEQGTSLVVYLPASDEKVIKDVPVEEEFVRGGKILVMDDEEDVRDSLASFLTLYGFKAEVAADGAQAIKAYEEANKSGKPFDVVVMDLTVCGGVGGVKAAGELLKIDPDVKAVVISGYSNDPVMANYKKYGFISALKKPFDIEELCRVLQKAIAGKRS